MGLGPTLLQRQPIFFKCLLVSATKVSNDLKKYLPKNSKFKYCSEPDVHDLTSHILSILIDFVQDRAVT